MPPQLMALSEGPNILLDKPIMLVGRHPECDIQIPSRKVSRRHCCIAQVQDHLVVRDLCSTNGIRINGVRVAEGALKSGDELTIGSFRYQLRWPALAGGPLGAASSSLPPLDHPDIFQSCDVPIPIPDELGGQPTPAAAALKEELKELKKKPPPPMPVPDIAPPNLAVSFDLGGSDEFKAPLPPST